MVNVLLVEDSRLTREMIQGYLSASGRYRVQAALENAANAVLACLHGAFDLVLMDVCTAEDESGLEAAARLKRYAPGLRVVIMTSMPEYSFLQKAKDAGCDGFWYKEHGRTDLLTVLDLAMAGDPLFPAETPQVPVGLTTSGSLTQRELEVVRLLAQGRKYEEVAAALGISLNTVKYHIKNLLSKTGHRNVLQLVVDVVEKKLVLPRF